MVDTVVPNGEIVDGAYPSRAMLGWMNDVTDVTNLDNGRGQNFNVLEYGAKGDGVTDDTDAIQRAFAAAQAVALLAPNGAAIYFPTGWYNISAACTIHASQITIYGDGESSLIQLTSATADGFVIGTGTFLARLTVRDIMFHSTVARTAGNALRFNTTTITRVDNVAFSGQWVGLLLNGGTDYLVSNVECINTQSIGMEITGGAQRVNVSNFECFRISGSPIDTGIFIRHASDVRIVNLITLTCGFGIRIGPTSAGQAVYHVALVNHLARTCSYGVYMNPVPADVNAIIYNTSFQNCDWILSGVNGFLAARGGTGTNSGISIDNCRSLSNGAYGILIDDVTSNNVSITNCGIAGNSTTTPGASHGIYLTSASNITIANNQIGKWGPVTGTQGWGLLLANASAINILVTGNNGHGNVSGLAWPGAPTNVNQRWDSNIAGDSLTVTAATTITAPMLSDREAYCIVNGNTTIDNITPSWGRHVTFYFTGAPLVRSSASSGGGNIYVNGDFQAAQFSTLTLLSNGVNWHEVARSPVNNWRNYTTTVTATGGGGFTATVNVARYYQIGKMITVEVQFTITAVGGGGMCLFTLPTAYANIFGAAAGETAVVGHMGSVLPAGGSTVILRLYNGANSVALNHNWCTTFSYEAA